MSDLKCPYRHTSTHFVSRLRTFSRYAMQWVGAQERSRYGTSYLDPSQTWEKYNMRYIWGHYWNMTFLFLSRNFKSNNMFAVSSRQKHCLKYFSVATSIAGVKCNAVFRGHKNTFSPFSKTEMKAVLMVSLWWHKTEIKVAITIAISILNIREVNLDT